MSFKCLNCTATCSDPLTTSGWLIAAVRAKPGARYGAICSSVCLNALGAFIVTNGKLNTKAQGTVTGVT